MFETILYDLSAEQRNLSFMFYATEFPRSDNVLFMFYDFETTQDTKFSENAIEHIPILVCVQQFCSTCEMQDLERLETT
jgi:hypothetical protein